MARQFVRPSPGNKFTAAQRAEWGRQQDIARAARAAQPQPAPKKRASRSKTLVADTSGSTCFDELSYRDGVVRASFIGPGAGVYEYDVELSEARE
jgi:hypothetical protein